MGAAAMSEEGALEHRGHRVWWGRAGEASTSRSAPLLTIHGGPSLCHDYLEPLAGLAAERLVYFYDQYGCGRSDRADDPEEYDVELFVDELAAVREALGLDEVHLFAHSYGGALLLEYMLQRRPAGVLSLTLSNTFASVRDLDDGWDRRLAELSPGRGDALRAGPDADEEAWDVALQEFVTRFVLAGAAPPDCLARSQQHLGEEAYYRMHGPSWFQPTGRWSTWDASSRLGTIEVPALVVGGTLDQCPPDLAEKLASGIPDAQLVVLEAGHLPFYESPEDYLDLISDFLVRADARGRTGALAQP